MNGALVIIIILLLVIIGAGRISHFFIRNYSSFKKGFKDGVNDSKLKPKHTTELQEMKDAFFMYVRNEGWRAENEEIVFVNNPIITSILENMDSIKPLELHLPAEQVGVYTVNGLPGDDYITVRQQLEDAGFKNCIVYRNHVVGYNPQF